VSGYKFSMPPEDEHGIEAGRIMAGHTAILARGLRRERDARLAVMLDGIDESRLTVEIYPDGTEWVCCDGKPVVGWNVRDLKTETTITEDGRTVVKASQPFRLPEHGGSEDCE
jgi:hypothetical protein